MEGLSISELIAMRKYCMEQMRNAEDFIAKNFSKEDKEFTECEGTWDTKKYPEYEYWFDTVVFWDNRQGELYSEINSFLFDYFDDKADVPVIPGR